MGALLLPSLVQISHGCLNLCVESVFEMSAANNTAIGAGDTLRFLLPYSVDEWICRGSSCFEARRLAILPAGLTSAVKVCRFELEKTPARWWYRWKHWGGRRAVHDHTYDCFMKIPFCSFHRRSAVRNKTCPFNSKTSG